MNARFGGPVTLIVLGLVLALAVHKAISGIDLSTIGWIIAGAGVLWMILELVMHRPRTAVTRETTNVQAANGGRVVEHEVAQDRF